MLLKKKTFKSVSLYACLALLGCKQTSSSNCLSTSSKTLELSEQSEFIQGGYLHFGNKSCSAMFDISEITSESIRLKAYSARHCRFENGIALDQVLVSLFFENTSSRKAGYLKNIPAEESFVARATKSMAEAAKLNSPELNMRLLNALQIPTQYDPWSDDVFSDNKETLKQSNEADNSSLICNNFDQIWKIDDPQNQLTESCWSFLDLGSFDITIKKNSMKVKDFTFLSSQLTSKQQTLNAYLNKNNSLKRYYFEQRKQIDDIMSLLRLQKAAPLAYLLNFDICKPPVRIESLCQNQSRLIELMGTNFIEIDESGNTRNIFDRLADSRTSPHPTFVKGLTFDELRQGKRLFQNSRPSSPEEAEQLATAFAQEITSLLKDKTAIAAIKIRDMIAEQSKSVDSKSLSPALIVGTNFSIKSNSSMNMNLQYATFNAQQIVTDLRKIVLAPDHNSPGRKNIHGVSTYGTLRLGFPRNAEVVKFLPTDSGSVLTLSGVVPLMTLNTVDDVGTSGGTAILALPEINDEDTVSPELVAQRNSLRSRSAGKNQPTSKKGQVEVNSDSFNEGITTACR